MKLPLTIGAVLMAALILMFGGMMFWDILSAYGVSRGPDAFASRHRFFAWLLKRTRVDPYRRTSSKWVMWWRLIGILVTGVFVLSIGIRNAFG